MIKNVTCGCLLAVLVSFGLVYGAGSRDSLSRPAGKIDRILGQNMIASAGDKVGVVFNKRESPSVGSEYVIYKMKPDLVNSGSELDDADSVEEILGTLVIEKLTVSRHAVAKLITVLSEIEVGNMIKKDSGRP